MKVLIVFNHPAPYKIRLFNELAKYFDLEVIFERNKERSRPDNYYTEKEFNFKYTILKHGYFGEDNSYSSELRNIIKNRHNEFDLIIMNGYSKIAELKAIKYMNKHNIPYTLLINGGLIKKESNFKKRYKSKYISTASNYLSPCEEADEYLTYYGADSSKILHYVYSTVYEKDILDKPLTREEKLSLRKELGLPEGTLYISAAQFIKRKNNTQLIDCFKGLDSKLILIGDGVEKELYESIIKEKGIDNVIIKPFERRDNLFKIMKACDGFITLSQEDIYGHTTNEAFANGLPVLSSNKVVGSRHLIKEGINGYLVNLDDNKAIVDKINKLSKIDAKEAIKTAKENTIELMIKTTVERIKEIKR